MTGQIDMGSYPITGVRDPAISSQAATKNYVDNKFEDLGYKMHALWTYRSSKRAEDLLAGEFTVATESGGNPKLKVYLANKDSKWP